MTGCEANRISSSRGTWRPNPGARGAQGIFRGSGKPARWTFATRRRPGVTVSFAARTGGTWVTTHALVRRVCRGAGQLVTGDDRNPNPDRRPLLICTRLRLAGMPKHFAHGQGGPAELSYGDERLVGRSTGTTSAACSTPQSRFETKDFWVDGFVWPVVLADDNNFDMSNDLNISPAFTPPRER